MESQFKTIARGSRHGAPDKKADVEKLTSLYVKSELHMYKKSWKIEMGMKDKAGDFISTGANNLERLKTIEKWWSNRNFARSTEEDWDELVSNINTTTID